MPVGLCLTAFLQNHTPPQPCDVLRPSRSSNNTPTPVTPGTAPVDTGSNIGLSYQFEY